MEFAIKMVLMSLSDKGSVEIVKGQSFMILSQVIVLACDLSSLANEGKQEAT